ncbi:MAG: type II secretion system F family protein [Desulfovibrio sp.]|nr:type II secretion system F family protein [Desulfovibrio sp.]
MPEFAYVALDATGAQTSNVITAASAAEATAQLRERGVFVLDVRPMSKDKEQKSLLDMEIDLSAIGIGGPKTADIALLFRQLSVMLEAGVSLVRALSVLGEQSRKKPMQAMLRRINHRVEDGVPFSAALAAEKRAFAGPTVRMIEAAELSGELDLIMNRVADQMEARLEFKRKLVTTMIYPSMVIVMAVLAIAVMAVVVVPKFAPMLKGGKKLPGSTKAVMEFSTWLQANTTEMLVAVVAIPIIILLLRKLPGVGYMVDCLVFRIPVFKHIVQCGVVVGLCRTLGTLYSSGVPLVESLRTVRGTLTNLAAVRVLDQMIERVLDGERMSQALLENQRVIPSVAGEMVAMGEESGEMEKVLTLTAKIYDQMLDIAVKRLNALIEPLLIAVLGGIVGFVMFALISGMLAVYGA